MNAILHGALAGLKLQPGKPYRTQVNGQLVEVRVLERAKPDESPSTAGHEMIDLWLEVPTSPNARTLTVNISRPMLPTSYRIDESDLAPE